MSISAKRSGEDYPPSRSDAYQYAYTISLKIKWHESSQINRVCINQLNKTQFYEFCEKIHTLK